MSRSIYSRLSVRAGLVLTVGSGLMLAAGQAQAATMAGSYTVPVQQSTPITAAGFGVHQAACADVPATEDGWHFALPGKSARLVSLTVSFAPGGTRTITPASGNSAYVGSVPGAVLTSASAVVATSAGKQQVPALDLSSTCLAKHTPPPSSPSSPPSSPAGHQHQPSTHGNTGHHHKGHHKGRHHKHHRRHHKHHWKSHQSTPPPAPAPKSMPRVLPVTG